MRLVNQLDTFQSHSIHYVMVASRTTEDIKTLFNPGQAATTLQAIDNCRQLGDQVALPNVENGATFLMLDTRRFSQYTIDNFELTLYPQSMGNPQSLAAYVHYTEGKLRIIDATGISFSNFLQYLSEKLLQVNFTGMTIAMRVLFIGHEADGTHKVVQSVTLPVIFKDIKVDLNDVKGVYDCSFFPTLAMPDYGNAADWTNIGSATNYFSGEGSNLLGALVQSFEDSLNRESLKLYQATNARVAQRGKSFKDVGRFGRQVQYMITIPEKWESYKLSGPSQGASTETNFAEVLKQEDLRRAQTSENAEKKTDNSGVSVPKDSFVSAGAGWTIMEVLDKIFSQCVEIAKLANFSKTDQTPKTIIFYKQLVAVTSDTESFVVHVDVVEFEVPNVYLAESGQTSQVTDRDDQLFTTEIRNGKEVKVPTNMIELDYIFSGTNIDVLEFDLQIQNLAFMLSNSINTGASSMNTASSGADDQKDGRGAVQDEKIAQTFRPNDPVLIPRKSQYEKTNFTNYAQNASSDGDNSPRELIQQFTANLSAYYFQSPTKAKLVLRGNPHFLSFITPQYMPDHVKAVTLAADGTISEANKSVKTKYRDGLMNNLGGPNMTRQSNGTFKVEGQLSGPSITTTPLYASVNVFGPNVDFLTAEPIAGQDFAKRLFDMGYFTVMEVVTRIEGSKFTQELKMNTNALYGSPSYTAQGAQGTPS